MYPSFYKDFAKILENRKYFFGNMKVCYKFENLTVSLINFKSDSAWTIQVADTFADKIEYISIQNQDNCSFELFQQLERLSLRKFIK